MSGDANPLSGERMVRNNDVFRRANERIDSVAREYDIRVRVPFICECAESACREIVRLTLAQYGEVRSTARWFVTAPGHESVAGAMVDVIRVGDGYVIVEALGDAGDVAERLADR